MAMTAAERKRRQLERERQALLPLADATYPYLAKPFVEFWEENADTAEVDIPLELIGFGPLSFLDDRGPEAYATDDVVVSEDNRIALFKGSERSIGRAEVAIDLLLEAAERLAAIVNGHKTEELQARLREIEQGDLPDEASRKQALAQATHISRLLAELEKNHRVTLPKWRVKGI